MLRKDGTERSGRLRQGLTQFRDEILPGFLLLLFLGGCDPFGQITFTVAIELGPVFVDTEVFYDVVVAQLKIQVYEGYDAYFDKHQREEESGKKTCAHELGFSFLMQR